MASLLLWFAKKTIQPNYWDKRNWSKSTARRPSQPICSTHPGLARGSKWRSEPWENVFGSKASRCPVGPDTRAPVLCWILHICFPVCSVNRHHVSREFLPSDFSPGWLQLGKDCRVLLVRKLFLAGAGLLMEGAVSAQGCVLFSPDLRLRLFLECQPQEFSEGTVTMENSACFG